MSIRAIVAAIAVASVCISGSVARAEDPPTREQVEKLQQQLAEMQKAMEAMQHELDASKAAGGANPMMHRHMMGMQNQWRMMHDQTCEMAPGSCPLAGHDQR